MSGNNYFQRYFSLINNCLVAGTDSVLEEVADKIVRAASGGGKVILVGNGGSAAMASHVAVDLTKAAGIRAINFNEADLLTCLANDYGYEHWVAKALGFYSDPGDLVIVISSSGESKNILNGVSQAKAMKLDTITLSGFASDNALRKCGDVNLWADSKSYNIVEMTHHIWLVAIVDFIIERRSASENLSHG